MALRDLRYLGKQVRARSHSIEGQTPSLNNRHACRHGRAEHPLRVWLVVDEVTYTDERDIRPVVQRTGRPISVFQW
jgi:hypothetical protein